MCIAPPFGGKAFLLPAVVTAALVLGFFSPEAQAQGSAYGLLESTPLAPADFERTNSFAQALAGAYPPNQSSAQPWQTAPEWAAYRDYLANGWRSIDQRRLIPMQMWATSALADLREKSQSVFYPFSGPDFIYVNDLFPDATYTVMAGLEPIGTLPDFSALQQSGQLGPYLQEIKASLFTVLAASFFETKDMKAEFGNPLVDGLLPVLALFLAHDGFTIDNIQYASLGHNGVLHPHEAAGATVVQITYFRGDRSNARVLVYCQANLDDDGLKENPGFVRLMQHLGPGNTYLKAASYLLATSDFATIRDGILDNSVGVVEDDSGIPLHNFKASQWEVIPYGNYTGPLPIFQQYYQPDLAQFYALNPHATLTFGSGYKFNPAISSLLVAKKK